MRKRQIVLQFALVLGLSGIISNSLVYGAETPNTYSYTRTINWEEECNTVLSQLNNETATTEQCNFLYEKYLSLLSNGDITFSQYQNCIKRIGVAFNSLGIRGNQDYYTENGLSQYYAQQLKQGVTSKLYTRLREEGYLPDYPTRSKSEALVLGLAQYTAFRWANGTGVDNSENLRYSQTMQANYSSDLTGNKYTIRPDCSGLVFTLLKELGCKGVDNRIIQGFNTQTLVSLCKSGELARDPRIRVLDFDANNLQSGDIMVTSIDEPLTTFGTSEPLLTDTGIPIRKGHTEVFIDWANRSLNETLVWSWGSDQQVLSEFVGDKAIPLVKSNEYNYKYIIRFMGGFEAWEERKK